MFSENKSMYRSNNHCSNIINEATNVYRILWDHFFSSQCFICVNLFTPHNSPKK